MNNTQNIEEKKYAKLIGSKLIYEVADILSDQIVLISKNKKITVDKKFVEFMDGYIPEQNNRSSISIIERTFPSEIMLRHLDVYSATCELDRYINLAITLKAPTVRIIHGRHGGKIKEAVFEYLDNCKYVADYHYADVYEGHNGVTIATLKN